jgi:hypothetical protein
VREKAVIGEIDAAFGPVPEAPAVTLAMNLDPRVASCLSMAARGVLVQKAGEGLFDGALLDCFQVPAGNADVDSAVLPESLPSVLRVPVTIALGRPCGTPFAAFNGFSHRFFFLVKLHPFSPFRGAAESFCRLELSFGVTGHYHSRRMEPERHKFSGG